jgi:hypothetical protein
MALVKYNNNSISDITTPGSLAQGKMILISEQTASGSASISFTSGIDSTYPIYKFEFINIHPATDAAEFQFNMSIDSGSNYNVTKTTTWFNALHLEDDSDANLEYNASFDLAQSTAFQSITRDSGNGSDENSSGELFIYSPSSTTFVKHFMSTTNDYVHFNDGGSREVLDAIRFQMSSGNIDAGTIKMYGIKGD